MRLPNDSERHAIYGMNGTGKSRFATWCLSHRSYTRMPWIVIDFKRERLFPRIPGIEEIRLRDKPPRHAGLYFVRPRPTEDDQEQLDTMMWRIWEQGRTGVFLDEGYMMPRFNEPFKALLTQGRSLLTPVIALSQRPSWISPFIRSESNFHSIFFLSLPADLKTIRDTVPDAEPLALPEFHSYYFETKTRRLALLSPCPNDNETLNRFDMRRTRRGFLSLL